MPKCGEVKNLAAYRKKFPSKIVFDLSQSAAAGFGRSAGAKDPLPTLLTSSGRLYHKDQFSSVGGEIMVKYEHICRSSQTLP